MPPRHLTLRRIAAFTVLALLACAAQAAVAAPAAPLVIEDLGRGTATLDGPWQFHPGDNPAWASPSFDSSGWEQLSANQTWGMQGHAGLTGVAWYRCSIAIAPAAGVPPEFSLLVARIDDAYEIYWNGALIGRNGTLPPHPVRLYSQPPQTFDLGSAQRGVLAVRVWRHPLLSDDSREAGGFAKAPLIGSADAIAMTAAGLEFRWLRSMQFRFAENLLCAVIALLSFLLWCRAPARRVLFWTAGFALVPPLDLLLLNAHLGFPYFAVMGAVQPLLAVRDISLWFLLLWLLFLHENRVLSRVTQILACIGLANSTLDGLLVFVSWKPQWIRFVQIADAAATVPALLLEAFPLVLVSCAILQRRRLDSARWLVAILAFLDEMMAVMRDAIQQGHAFANWSFLDNIDTPLFSLYGSAISFRALAELLLLIAVAYAVYHSVLDDQRLQEALEREKAELLRESARMRYQAEHDGLTGLSNHRFIVEQLREELIRAGRNGTPLSVVLIDVDHFKSINDTFGHPAGDLVLRKLSTIFTGSLRPYDSVGRYGGEEFLLILPGCETDSALLRAEQLRAAVESARIVDGETTLEVTASFGVASAFPSNYEPDKVIRAVDSALYRAKNNGRNCVAPAETDLPLFDRHS